MPTRVVVSPVMSESGTSSSWAPLEMLKEFPEAPALLQILLVLFSLGTRPGPNPVRGIFSLSEMLCFILGALLFLVLIILVTQLYRWRAASRGGLQGVLGNMESVWKQEMGPGMRGGEDRV